MDFSSPRAHAVIGYDRHPIVFPSIAEPVGTTSQYLDFAALREGATVIDLGAYSGLTSILFRERCGPTGRVIAVEADPINAEACRRNFAAHRDSGGEAIDLIEGAIWTHDRGLSFSSEGGLGSAAAATVGARTGSTMRVSSFSLGQLADACRLDRVDFIKCDVEGAEAEIFADADFFARFRPRILIEVHPVDGRMTDAAVRSALTRHRYACNQVKQHGVDLPLLECVPLEAELDA